MVSVFLGYHNNKKQKRNKRRQSQNRNVSYYIFTTPSQAETNMPRIHDLDNRLASIFNSTFKRRNRLQTFCIG